MSRRTPRLSVGERRTPVMTSDSPMAEALGFLESLTTEPGACPKGYLYRARTAGIAYHVDSKHRGAFAYCDDDLCSSLVVAISQEAKRG